MFFVTTVAPTASEQRVQAEREITDAAQTVEDLEAKLDELKAQLQAQGDKLAAALASGQAQAIELAQLHELLSVAERDQVRSDLGARLVKAETDKRAELQAQGGKLAAAVAVGQAQAVELALVRERLKVAEPAGQAMAAQLRGQVAALQAQASALTLALGQRGAPPV